MADEVAAVAESAPASQSQEAKQQSLPLAETAAPAPAQEAQPQTAEQNTEASGSEPETELGEKGKKEIITLRKRAQQAEQDAAYFRGLADAQRPAQQQAVPQQAQAPQGPPVLDNFSNYDDYLVAKAKHEFNVEQQQREGQRQVQTLVDTHTRRVNDVMKKHPDLPQYAQVLARDPRITQNGAMSMAVMRSEVGPEIIMELGKNPAEAVRIAMLDPVSIGIEIGKLEYKIQSASMPKQTISQAPEPIKAVGVKGSVSNFDYEKSDMDSFMKRRNTEAPPRYR